MPGHQVTRTQWLDLSALGEMNNLVGKRVLIVDEVDDTRTTLEYAVRELEKDVETARLRMGSSEKTYFSIFVLHVRYIHTARRERERERGGGGGKDNLADCVLTSSFPPTSEQGQGEEGQAAP